MALVINFTPLAPCVMVSAACDVTPNQIVILRHSLYTLSGRDVMDAGFFSVATVTVGVLSAIVGVVTGLMLAGIAQVRLFYESFLDRCFQNAGQFAVNYS